MRILIAIERHTGGGAEVAVAQQTEVLTTFGHSVAHFCLDFDADKTPCGVPHFFAGNDLFSKKQPRPLSQIFRFLNYWRQVLFLRKEMAQKLREAINTFKPDIVHFHAIREFRSPEVLAVPKTMGVPAVYTAHSSSAICPSRKLLKGGKTPCDAICAKENPGQSCVEHQCIPHPIGRWLAVRDFRHLIQAKTLETTMDLVTAPSQALVDLIVSTGIVAKNHARLHYNAASPTLLKTEPDFSKPLVPSYFLFSGRLTWYKGIWPLLEAFKTMPDIALKIVGEGPEASAMKRFIETQGLENVTMLGWQSGEALWSCYRNAYALVVPSLWFENAPMAILESFSVGKPVIGVNYGGVPGFVRHEKTGLLFEKDDIGDLSEQLRHLWSDPPLAKRLGQEGYRFLREHFSPEAYHQSTLELYNSLVTPLL